MKNEQEKHGKWALAWKQTPITKNVNLTEHFSVKELLKEYSHSPQKKITHQIAAFILYSTAIYHQVPTKMVCLAQLGRRLALFNIIYA